MFAFLNQNKETQTCSGCLDACLNYLCKKEEDKVIWWGESRFKKKAVFLIMTCLTHALSNMKFRRSDRVTFQQTSLDNQFFLTAAQTAAKGPSFKNTASACSMTVCDNYFLSNIFEMFFFFGSQRFSLWSLCCNSDSLWMFWQFSRKYTRKMFVFSVTNLHFDSNEELKVGAICPSTYCTKKYLQKHI